MTGAAVKVSRRIQPTRLRVDTGRVRIDLVPSISSKDTTELSSRWALPGGITRSLFWLRARAREDGWTVEEIWT